jgi:hypothetical protein
VASTAGVQVIGIMKLCDDMHGFRKKFDRVFKKFVGEQLDSDLLIENRELP